MIDKIFKYNNIEFLELDNMIEYINNNTIKLDFDNAICDNGLHFKDINIDDKKDERKKIVQYSYTNKKGEIKNYKYEVIIDVEKQKGYSNKYFQNHKDKYLEKINCEYCNCKISKCNLLNHNKSNKHVNNVKKYNENNNN